MSTKTPLHHAKSAFSINKLFLAIAAQTLFATVSHAGPTGGDVVGGNGSITQSGSLTQIQQDSARLAIEWDTFNVNSDERVRFIQPSSESIALNRILDNNPSAIMGRINANGRIILSNPNGITFGSGSTVNVQSLIAAGLDISAGDFMAGDLDFNGIDGTAGVVISKGLIAAATGGNVALLGKTVKNSGIIQATLGRVALASGNEAVLSFDEAGLLGVRIEEAALQEDGVFAVTNTGDIKAHGGKVLLSASASEDLFSSAVNHGHLNGNVEAVIHDDGSFTLGAGGGNVSSQGVINVSTGAESGNDAGQVIVVGEKILQKGAIKANAHGDNLAGNIQIQAVERVTLSNPAVMEARNSSTISGRVKVEGGSVQSSGDSKVLTTGNALFSANYDLHLPLVNAHHAHIFTPGALVTQNWGMKTTGNLHVFGLGTIHLTHAANDFHSVSAEQAMGPLKISDRNDLLLGDMDLEMNYVTINASGALSQIADTSIYISETGLTLSGTDVVLGNGSSSTTGVLSELDLRFSRSIDTNNSINFSVNALTPTDVLSITGSSDGMQAISVTGDNVVDLAAEISGEYLQIDSMTGQNATLSGLFETTQTGAIQLSDTLTWNSYWADLTHAGNDIGALAGTGGIAFGRLNYVDNNDVDIRNLDTTSASENEVYIKSVGANATIRQLDGTRLAASFIELDADNIELGAAGTSEVRADYLMDLKFGRVFLLDGSLKVGSYAPVLRITGNDNDNNFTIGENINYEIFSEQAAFPVFEVDLGAGRDTATFNGGIVVAGDSESIYSFDMGAGNDRVYLNNHMTLPITLGEGADHVEEYEHGTIYELVDFNSAEDTYDIINP